MDGGLTSLPNVRATSTRSSSVRRARRLCPCTNSFSGQTIKLSAPGANRGQWMEVFRHCQTHEMAKIPQVEHFLFCYSLRTGILFFSAVAVLFQFVQLLCLAFTYDTAIIYLNDFHGGGGPYTQGAGFGLAIVLANMTLCVLLIIGVLYKKPGFFLPWLAVSGFTIAVLALGLILVVILMPIYLSDMPALTAGFFFLVLFIMGCCMHLFCVVHTYYKQLKEPEKVNLRLEITDPVKIPYNALA